MIKTDFVDAPTQTNENAHLLDQILRELCASRCLKEMKLKKVTYVHEPT